MVNELKFFFQSDIQKLFEHFTELTGIRIAFYSPEGKEMIVGCNRPICEYCALLRKKYKFEQTCLKLDNAMRQHAAKSKNMIAYKCHGGLNEAIFPVYSFENLLGFIMIGQFRTPELSSPILVNSSKRDLKKLNKSYLNVPYFKSEQLPHILGIFGDLIELIVSHRMINTTDNPLTPLINYMKENIELNLSLDHAAKFIHKSKSSLQHLFKKVTGQSFKQFQIELKLEKADELLRTLPKMTLREIANNIGFEDQFYFSRLYKKYRNSSPRMLVKTKDTNQ